MDLQALKQSEPKPVELVVTPEYMPRAGNHFTRWLGAKVLALMGWKIRGDIPNYKKIIIAGAPHTSNWDFIVAMFLVLGVGVKFSYLMKKEAFFWPFKGLFMRLGGIPIDRKKGAKVISQVSDWFKKNERCWVAITPEGTRAKVERYKTGFLRLAYELEVPLLLVAWDYPSKTFNFIGNANLSGDLDEDLISIQSLYNEHFTGRNPHFQ